MLPRQSMASPPCCHVPWTTLALAVSKVLRDVPLHIFIPPRGCLFGLDKWPPGARAAILCVLGLLLVSVKVIILLSCLTRGQRSLWRCQSKGPGAEVLCMHVHTHKYIYSCHSDLLIHSSKRWEDWESGLSSRKCLEFPYLSPSVTGPLDSRHPPPASGPSPVHLPGARMPKQTC